MFAERLEIATDKIRALEGEGCATQVSLSNPDTHPSRKHGILGQPFGLEAESNATSISSLHRFDSS